MHAEEEMRSVLISNNSSRSVGLLVVGSGILLCSPDLEVTTLHRSTSH